MQQPLCGAQSQAINSHQCQHTQDGRIRIGLRCSGSAGLLLVNPGTGGLFIEPDGEAATLDEGLVIVRPVTKVVSAFAVLLFHTPRVPALLPPRLFMQQRPCTVSGESRLKKQRLGAAVPPHADIICRRIRGGPSIAGTCSLSCNRNKLGPQFKHTQPEVERNV